MSLSLSPYLATGASHHGTRHLDPKGIPRHLLMTSPAGSLNSLKTNHKFQNPMVNNSPTLVVLRVLKLFQAYVVQNNMSTKTELKDSKNLKQRWCYRGP